MLKLSLEGRDLSQGAVALSWCLDRDSARATVGESYVVIIVAPQEDYSVFRERRFVEPLGQRMAFISFVAPGPCRIFAEVVCGRSDVSVKNEFLGMSYGRYDKNVLSYDGSCMRGFPERLREEMREAKEMCSTEHLQELQDRLVVAEAHAARYRAHLDVDVPAEAFGKPPAKWERELVGAFFRARPEDECGVQRLRLLYPFLGLILLLSVVARSFFLLLGAFAGGWPKFKILNPLRYSWRDFMNDEQGFSGRMFWLPRHDGAPWRLALLPLAPFMVLLTGLLAMANPGRLPSWFPSSETFLGFVTSGILMGYAIMIALVVVVPILVLVVAFVLGKFGITRKLIELAGRLADRVQHRPLPGVVTDEEIEALCCESGSPTSGVASVPARYRSIRLRYLDLKAKNCKPLSR